MALGMLWRNWKVAPEHVILGNGSDEIIGLLAKAFLQLEMKPSSQILAYRLQIDVTSSARHTVLVPLTRVVGKTSGLAQAVSSKTRMVLSVIRITRPAPM